MSTEPETTEDTAARGAAGTDGAAQGSTPAGAEHPGAARAAGAAEPGDGTPAAGEAPAAGPLPEEASGEAEGAPGEAEGAPGEAEGAAASGTEAAEAAEAAGPGSGSGRGEAAGTASGPGRGTSGGDADGAGTDGDTDGTGADGDAHGTGTDGDTDGTGADGDTDGTGADGDTDGTGADSDAHGTGTDGDTDGTGADGDIGGTGADGDAGVSEAQAELAAQRVERERIARRKAERHGTIDSGAKLSGRAADLLAAVRAVEGGAAPAATVFAEPGPPRRPAAGAERTPPPRPAPVPPPASAGPAAETVEAVRDVLVRGGAPQSLARPVAAALGESAAGRLREDPWQLLRVTGVRPEQADGFARALLGAECGPGDERRGRSVTGWLLEQAAAAGHTALELPALTAALARYGVPDPDAAVQGALTEGEALAFQDALDEPEGTEGPAADPEGPGADGGGTGGEDGRPVRVLVGLERYALAEESLADGLARLIDAKPAPGGPAGHGEGWERAAAAGGAAAELVRAVAGNGLVLHTGGEASLAEVGTLLDAARGLGLRAWAAAHGPLGRSRFDALTGASGGSAGAVTLAGLLSGAEGPGRDADGALDLDLLAVIDAPLMDVETAALVAESLPDGARLVLAGDPGVLWSSGPGRVFADLLAARVCPRVASRRPDPGPLGELVSGIGVGELNQVEAPGRELVIVPVRDAGEAVHRTVQLVADSVPRAIGVPAEQTVVITPGHGGAAGTRALNAALKERLNPGPGRFGGFDAGDRVVHSPAPGRTLPGHVVTADADGLHLSCAGGPVVVPKERVEQTVRHGWALTAQQAAGGRWPAVVVVLPGDAVRALSRPWVYTAFGRAGRHLSVVHGVDQALSKAVAEIPAKPRTTRLTDLLTTQPAAHD